MPLNNAVGDARGVLAAFERLGFESIAAPLLDDEATLDRIRELPARLKPQLGWNDSLVVFFAGHGHTATPRFPDGVPVPKGFLIPVDADRVGGERTDDREHTWQRIEPWLTMIAELPPRHILVILDSCHSGIALGGGNLHRGLGVRADGSVLPVHERRGRWVFASALENQRAEDGGPFRGHSVFTGYLIEALRGRARTVRESSGMSVDEVAAYVSRCVENHSHSKQVPALGLLAFHDFGRLLFSPAQPRAEVRRQPSRPQSRTVAAPRSDGRGRPFAAQGPLRSTASGTPVSPKSRERERTGDGATAPDRLGTGLPDRSEGWALDAPVTAALDRQGEERRRGARVLTVIAGDAMAAQTAWGTWAAGHGHLTLATHLVGRDPVIADLLAQTPWLRCVPEARKRLAAAARIDVQEVDAALDARSPSERCRWIDDVAPGDPHARASGWLLSSLRQHVASIPDPTDAPVPAGELLAIACDLASPTAVLLFHPTPDERWLERAIATAAELIDDLPAHSVAVTAPEEIVARVIGEHRRGAAWTMARQGLISVESRARRIPGRARHSTMRVLFEALAHDPRTRARFELHAKHPTRFGPTFDVALVAHGARIAVELDGWYHFHDPEGYRRDRVQDTRLARAGYFVLRFPAEDVDDRLASTIDHLAIALAGRRAVRAISQENFHGSFSR
jgi:very-short-patch-repair endonuclease